MNVLKFGGALAVLAVVYGWNQIQSHAAFNDAVNRYNLQPAQVTVMRSCIASMSQHRRKFKRGAKREIGCACIAQHATHVVGDNQYEAAGHLIATVIKASKSPKSKRTLVKALQQDPEFQRIAPRKRLLLLTTVGHSLRVCGNKSNRS
jgi:hypothetical protein